MLRKLFGKTPRPLEERPQAAAAEADRQSGLFLEGPQATAITIEGELAEQINRGEAINIGLMVYDVATDKLCCVSFTPEASAILSKFNIFTSERLK